MRQAEGNAVRPRLEPGRPERAVALPRVLVVDDDQVWREALETVLGSSGLATTGVSGGEAALREVERSLPDLVITDLQMPGMSGLELCARLRKTFADLPVIVMTAFGDMDTVITCLRAGAEDYLIKPTHDEAVLWSVERAIARRAAKLDAERRRREDEELMLALNERLLRASIREQELAEAEALQHAQLAELLAHLDDGVTIADARGRIVMMNDAARDILGLRGAEPATVDDLAAHETLGIDGRPLPSERRPLARALRGEQFHDYEVTRMRSGGDCRRTMSTGTSVKDSKGQVALAIVVLRDVTELRRLEQQRDEFLGLVSHDLRNPLTSILFFVATLKGALALEAGVLEKREQLANLAERAERSVRRLNAMIDQLNEATSLESNGVTLKRVPCELHALARGVVDDLDPARSRRVVVEDDDAGPYLVLADPMRLERVVANLLTNALKYSEETSRVVLRVAHVGSDVELAVVDKGIGIPPESARMLFDRYYRAPGGKARAAGLGLGLYIARLLVEAHGGRIDVASELGRGSTFRVVLPSVAPSGRHAGDA